MIGDLVGFAAACYQRGAPFIQVPTTLLSQVDSSSGRQDGDQPPAWQEHDWCVLPAQIGAGRSGYLGYLAAARNGRGYVEVIKYGLIRDPAFWLEQQAAGLMHRDKALLAQAVYQSCAHKAEVVARDEREAGERALLNLGHTFGAPFKPKHGLRQLAARRSCGCRDKVMAALLSEQLGWLDQAAIERIKALFRRVGLPVDMVRGWQRRRSRPLSVIWN